MSDPKATIAMSIGDGTRHFEPRSNDKKHSAAGSSLPDYHTYGRTFNLNRFNVHPPLLHGGYSVAPGLEPVILHWLATLTVVPLGLGSNPGEDMDVFKCIVPLRHGCTLNSRRAASPSVRLVEGEERGPDHPQGVIPQNWSETELNRSVTCMVLKATANDRRHLCHDEFHGL
ncbi:uncharacterized protein TNCV_904241 [Trichonephila clavipes]|nr:uncharacterized protein TNCV_904241 [Trichonephila clavipes]